MGLRLLTGRGPIHGKITRDKFAAGARGKIILRRQPAVWLPTTPRGWNDPLNPGSKQPVRHWLESWHVDPSGNRNYDFIDGLRAVAILMVMACHALYANENNDPAKHCLLSFTVQLGEGVFLFFTLSGFLIALPFWKRKAAGAATLIPGGYGWRRFWKIYPPLALSILLLTPGYILINGSAREYVQTAAQWLTAAAFLVPVNNQINPVMWSLVIEIHFYLALPLLFLLTKPLPARTCLWFIPLVLFAVPLAIQTTTGVVPTYQPKIGDPLCTGLSCFCFGVAAAGLDVFKVWNRSWSRIGEAGWGLMLLGLAGQGWASLNPAAHPAMTPHLFHWIFILGTGCLLCYAAAADHPHARWLCSPWLRWCGIISYELYLFHWPAFIWSRLFFGATNGNIFKYALVLGAPLVVSFAVAALVYRLFSLPILRYGRARKSAQK